LIIGLPTSQRKVAAMKKLILFTMLITVLSACNLSASEKPVQTAMAGTGAAESSDLDPETITNPPC
jgi:hypothetical protein